MENLLLTLNQPLILWSLFTAAVLLVLIDYLFPVDWLAYVGYVLFAVFIGATISTTPTLSLLTIVVVIAVMLLLHAFVFSKYLTNVPRYERPKPEDADERVN